MNSSEKSDFINLFVTIAELYSKQISESMLETYWNVLKKYSLQKIERAMHLHLLNPECGKFMPKPANLLKYLEPNIEEMALIAWSSVVHAIKSVGAQGSLIFSDSLIHLVIDDMGGWINFCQMQTFQIPFVAKEFQQRYMNYQHLNIQIQTKPIIGFYSDVKPILIQSKTHIQILNLLSHI